MDSEASKKQHTVEDPPEMCGARRVNNMLRRCCRRVAGGLLVLLSPQVVAGEAPAPGVGISGGQVFTVLAGLAFVLLLVFGFAWLVKRFSGMPSARSSAIKVLAVMPVGSRERLALVEVGGQQLLLGVTAQQITRLHTFDESVVDAQHTKNNSEFAQKLHQLMSRS